MIPANVVFEYISQGMIPETSLLQLLSINLKRPSRVIVVFGRKRETTTHHDRDVQTFIFALSVSK